MGFMLGDNYPI